MSRAECPVASTTRVASMVVPSSKVTPRILSPLTTSPVTRAPKRTSPPARRMLSRIAAMMSGSLFVPMCGCASTRMSGLAPKATKVARMRAMSSLLAAPRVELAVAVRAGAALAEAVVAVGIDLPALGDGREVEASRAHVLAALEDQRTQTELDGAQGREEPGRARARRSPRWASCSRSGDRAGSSPAGRRERRSRAPRGAGRGDRDRARRSSASPRARHERR